MRPIVRSSKAVRFLLIGLAPGLLSVAIAAADPGAQAPAAPGPDRARVTCEAAVQHPIQVRVEALDPIRRGAAVRLRVTSRSTLGLSEAEARVVSAGGATVLGRRSVALGRVVAQREASAEFVMAVPSDGRRFLVEFRVEGEGPAGRIGRGASFNLFPDGPVAARVVAGSRGQIVAEYPARRMPR